MSYSIDTCYKDYFKSAAEGKYDTTPVRDRLKVTGMAAGTALAGSFRTIGRTFNLITEIAKVCFYAHASLFTLGKHGNAHRFNDHCKLLALNTSALAAQPLQVTINTLAIALGVVSPKAAYKVMQGASTPLAWITSKEREICQQYSAPKIYTRAINAFKTKITNAFNKHSWTVQRITKTLINEFPNALDSALVAPLGFMDQFHSFEANPTKLTDEQKELTPILMLNGNYSHQATFLPLLHKLTISNNKRPVYTINLAPNTIDPKFISSTVEAIKQQYGKSKEDLFEIDMIGHSMGSELIQYLCTFPDTLPGIQVGRAITIGTPFKNVINPNTPKKRFDVIGKNDLLVSDKSLLSKSNQREINTGHLGLLFHPESLKAIEDFLKK